MPEIDDDRLAKAAEDEAPELLEVDLGRGRTWWSTRLLLVASLARDFADVQTRRLTCRPGEKRLVGLAAPVAEVARALAAVHPQLAAGYAPAKDARTDDLQFQPEPGIAPRPGGRGGGG